MAAKPRSDGLVVVVEIDQSSSGLVFLFLEVLHAMVFVQLALFTEIVAEFEYPWGVELQVRRVWWDGYFEVLSYTLLY